MLSITTCPSLFPVIMITGTLASCGGGLQMPVFYAVHIRHHDIHQNDVRLDLAHHIQDFNTLGRTQVIIFRLQKLLINLR